jgi:hypothetical protein
VRFTGLAVFASFPPSPTAALRIKDAALMNSFVTYSYDPDLHAAERSVTFMVFPLGS